MDPLHHPKSVISKMKQAVESDKDNFFSLLQEAEDLRNERNREMAKLQVLKQALEYEKKEHKIMEKIDQKLDSRLNKQKRKEEKHERAKQELKDEMHSYIEDIRSETNKYYEHLGFHLHCNSACNPLYQIQFSFFSEDKSEDNIVICEWNDELKTVKLIDIKPRPAIFECLRKSLEASNEMHQLLYWVRKFFKHHIHRSSANKGRAD